MSGQYLFADSSTEYTDGCIGQMLDLPLDTGDTTQNIYFVIKGTSVHGFSYLFKFDHIYLYLTTKRDGSQDSLQSSFFFSGISINAVLYQV